MPNREIRRLSADLMGTPGAAGRDESLAPLRLARHPVAVIVHLGPRAVLQEEGGLGTGCHLRARRPPVAPEVLELLAAHGVLQWTRAGIAARSRALARPLPLLIA